jgi:hypothetical protein
LAFNGNLDAGYIHTFVIVLKYGSIQLAVAVKYRRRQFALQKEISAGRINPPGAFF